MSVWAGESIHDAILSQLTSAPTGKKITKMAFTWTADGKVETLKAYDGHGYCGWACFEKTFRS
jgi:hypothetical protein